MITDFAFKLDGSGNVVSPHSAYQCFAVSKTGDPVYGGWNYYSILSPGGLDRLPEVRRLAGRDLHVGGHLRLRAGGSYLGRTCGR